MADQRDGGIAWTDKTWNPIRASENLISVATQGRDFDDARIGWHCEKVSEACRNCYAEAMNNRFGTKLPYTPASREQIVIFLDEKLLLKPLHWKRPRRIFLSSMTDIFADFVTDEMLDRIFAVMALCPQHTFQVLTKRPERMKAYMDSLVCGEGYRPYVRRPGWQGKDPRDGDRVLLLSEGQRWPLPNVWLGVTAENQTEVDRRIPLLLATPAAQRWVSIEPMLGPIDLTKLTLTDETAALLKAAVSWRKFNALAHFDFPGIDWVVCGGESGKDARPSHPDWFRSLCDQCAAAGVPFLFKQWGGYLPVGQSLPGCGKIHGATAVKPGRMKLHYVGTPKQVPEYAFAERGVEFASTEDGRLTFRVGVKAAGRLLDGVEHNAFPASQPQRMRRE